MTRISRRLLADALRVADFLTVIAAGGIAFLLYVVHFLDAAYQNIYYLTATAVAAGVYLAIAYALEAYRYDRLSDLSYLVRRSMAALGSMALIWLIVAFATKTTEFWSRGWVLIWLGCSLVMLIAWRVTLAVAIRHWRSAHRWQDRIVLVGATEIAARLVQDIRQRGADDAEIVGVFDERGSSRNPDMKGMPVFGNVEALLEFTRYNYVDCVVVALPWSNEERILRLSEKLSVLPVDINVAFPTQTLHHRIRGWDSAYGVPLMQIAARPLTDRQVFLKRLEDVVLTSIIAVAVAPVLLLVALAIKIESRGPILFRQPRHGFNNTTFDIYKFRTMFVDKGDVSGRERTRVNDPRVTRVGRFLRRWSIDELPQLLNVLRGEMSLIGPRPHPVGMRAADADYREVVANYAARHRMRPGITGWAQVAGFRGEAETIEKARRRVEFDLEYIANWSLLFDARILALTLVAVIGGKGAY